ncbi:hypothetical protein EIL87_04350 [Saccharopolyspora rhizosphaerae]|uniref:Glycosyltransferase RgtA/B/C/D-like domain-containing protein n=1 Tax=Saccharopolyspora rhizosphaerae TaxID=2492662 RepID=A0A3R8Q8L3_9PSEU|nr:hypothetical protein [Saccharopolyspora rhizosphaerae]RRO19344.1 hypothetical protein EIL87_04350 [Saccharopolyspora rhizosphaerae]
MTNTASETGRQAPAPSTPPLPGLARRFGPLLLALSAVVPPLMMLREVLRYPQMHFYDYWWVLLDITDADGSLRPEALVGFRNEHPFVLPSLLFWLSARFGHGLNQPLGLVVLAMGVGCVLLVALMLPRHLTAWQRAGLVAATSTLVFNPHGIHNYVRSMSGASWVLAMLLVLGALLAAHRGRRVVAVVLGLLASISYGTSFAVWPALALVAWLRGDRRKWIATPLVVGFVVVATWLVLRGPQGGGGDSPTDDPAQALLAGLSMLGMVWTGTEPSVALLAGVAGLGVLVLHVHQSESERRVAAPWWGLALHALGCAVMISGSRAAFGESAGLQSRYNSMAAALWIAVLVIVVAWARWPRFRAVAVGGTVLATVALGAPMAQSVRADAPRQQLLAVAARIGHPDAFTDRFPSPGALLPRLRALGHYPFSPTFSLGCPDGLTVDDRVSTAGWRSPSVDSLREPRPDGRDVVLNVETDQVQGGARMLEGWAISGIERARCVAVLDQEGTVVGGGVVDLPRSDAEAATPGIESGLGFQAVAPARPGLLRVAFQFPDGWWIRPLTEKPQVAR